MSGLRKMWKESATLRYATRATVVAGLGYILTVVTAGIADGFTWQKFVLGLLGATIGALYAALGATTPLEPFVGINKAAVEVPAPPGIAQLSKPRRRRRKTSS